MTIFLAIVVLLLTSPFDFIIMWLGGERKPHPPELWRITDGSWYHKAKGYWAQSFRDDGEYWSKLARFLIWWLVFYILVF